MAGKVPTNGLNHGIPFFTGDTGSIYTHDVSGTDSTAQYNTAYGLTAMDAITTGDRNTAIGYGAGGALTVATDCVFVGRQAGVATTEGTNSTFVGSDAGAAVTTGLRNTMIGAAGWQFDAENDNLGIGHNALAGAIAGGGYNVAIGNYAGDALTSGDSNVFIGYQAGSGNTTGQRGVAIGYQAMDSAATSSTGNICIGYHAGRAIDSGEYNCFIGYTTGQSNTTGSANVGVGQGCLPNPDTESNNIAIGMDTLAGSIAGGEYNIAIGRQSLDALTSADYCTAVGYQAGTNIAASDGQNTLMGYQAGTVITTGGYNTIIGSQADTGQNDANYNTLVGVLAVGSGNGHQIVMGYNNGSAGNGYVTLGQGTGGDKIYANYTSNATWTKASDERIKKDIETNTEIGLDFINELRTVKFKKKNHSEVDANLAIYDASDTDARDDIHYGLIAQEVKAAMDKHSITEFQGWHKLSKEVSPDEIQGVSEQMFVYPLIKAVQELAAKVKALEEA